MIIVDLFGASGVGKSTTYRALCELGGFVPALQIDYAPSFRILEQSRKHDPSIRAFTDLLETVFATARGPRVGSRRNHTLRSLRMVLQNRANALNSVVVIDGGLMQRGQAIDCLQSDVALADYYRTMPIPDVAVMFTAPLETIIERNVGRGGDHDRSKDARRSLEVHEIGWDIVACRGAKALICNTENDPAHNAAELAKMIRSL